MLCKDIYGFGNPSHNMRYVRNKFLWQFFDDISMKIYEAAGKYLNAKEELWKLKYFTMQKYNIKKIPLKETKNPS